MPDGSAVLRLLNYRERVTAATGPGYCCKHQRRHPWSFGLTCAAHIYHAPANDNTDAGTHN